MSDFQIEFGNDIPDASLTLKERRDIAVEAALKKVAKGKTALVFAYPGCGVTTACENEKNKYSTLDLKMSNFKFDFKSPDPIKESDRFHEEYLNKIVTNIGKVDIIFFDGDRDVFEELRNLNLDFITVAPDRSLLLEWIGRLYVNDYVASYIDSVRACWNRDMHELYDIPAGSRDKKSIAGKNVVSLSSNQYVNLDEVYRTYFCNDLLDELKKTSPELFVEFFNDCMGSDEND